MPRAVPSPLLYYFPGLRSVPGELQHRFANCTMAKNSPGPDGNRGLLASPFSNVYLAYDKSSQRWDRIGNYYVGCTRQIDPDILERKNARGGHRVKLADGNEWVIPVANPNARRCVLPFWDVLNPERKFEKRIHDEFLELSNRALEIAHKVTDSLKKEGESSVQIDDDDLRATLADALMINYDVTLEELSVLRVFSPDIYWPAINALIDGEQLLAVFAELIEGAANGTSPLSDAPDTGNMSDGDVD